MNPHVEVISAAIAGSSNTMLDRVITGPAFAAVIDGATDHLTPGAERTEHYVDTLAESLNATLSEQQPLTVALRNSIAAAAAEVGGPPAQLPSATVAIATWSDSVVDALVLGDCSCVALLSNHTHDELHDDRLTHVGSSTRSAYRGRLRAGSGFDDHHRALLAQLAELQASARNTEDGFWVAQGDPAAAEHALTATWPSSTVDAIVLATDGARTGLIDVGGGSWRELTRATVQSQLERLLLKADTAEHHDPTGQRWPRSKPGDDKAVAVITFSHTSRPRSANNEGPAQAR